MGIFTDTGWYVLAGVSAVLLILALTRTLKNNRKFVVGERRYRKTEHISYDEVWYCPQCFRIYDKPGVCQNNEHDTTPVQLVQGSHDRLEYYASMQTILGTEE